MPQKRWEIVCAWVHYFNTLLQNRELVCSKNCKLILKCLFFIIWKQTLKWSVNLKSLIDIAHYGNDEAHCRSWKVPCQCTYPRTFGKEGVFQLHSKYKHLGHSNRNKNTSKLPTLCACLVCGIFLAFLAVSARF